MNNISACWLPLGGSAELARLAGSACWLHLLALLAGSVRWLCLLAWLRLLAPIAGSTRWLIASGQLAKSNRSGPIGGWQFMM